MLMPRRGSRFLGSADRARARARDRRRKVFTLLLEGIGLTGLIGLFPPLRDMWMVTGILIVLLVAYVWLLLQLRARETVPAAAPAPRRVTLPPPPIEPSPQIGAPGEPRVVVIRDEDAPARRAGIAG